VGSMLSCTVSRSPRPTIRRRREHILTVASVKGRPAARPYALSSDSSFAPSGGFGKSVRSLLTDSSQPGRLED
jgi:hypothetical protein